MVPRNLRISLRSCFGPRTTAGKTASAKKTGYANLRLKINLRLQIIAHGKALSVVLGPEAPQGRRVPGTHASAWQPALRQRLGTFHDA